MHAGRLDRLATIETPTETRDAYGAIVPGWTEHATVRASVRALMPREARADGAQVAMLGYLVTIHYRPDITPTMRVVVDGRALLVRGSSEIGRRQWLQLLCDEVNP